MAKKKRTSIKEAYLSQMIKCILEKNYAQANKYLEQALTVSLRKQIVKACKEPLF